MTHVRKEVCNAQCMRQRKGGMMRQAWSAHVDWRGKVRRSVGRHIWAAAGVGEGPTGLRASQAGRGRMDAVRSGEPEHNCHALGSDK